MLAINTCTDKVRATPTIETLTSPANNARGRVTRVTAEGGYSVRARRGVGICDHPIGRRSEGGTQNCTELYKNTRLEDGSLLRK